jgi:hypothetical protein
VIAQNLGVRHHGLLGTVVLNRYNFSCPKLCGTKADAAVVSHPKKVSFDSFRSIVFRVEPR